MNPPRTHGREALLLGFLGWLVCCAAQAQTANATASPSGPLGEGSNTLSVNAVDNTQTAEYLLAHPQESVSSSARLTLARAEASSGRLADARKTYAAILASVDPSPPHEALVDYFLLERDHGSQPQAEAAYTRLRDAGYRQDPLAYYRLSLTLRYPGSGWAWRDSIGILALLMAMAAQVLLPALIVAPVHYRGLVRRVRGQTPEPARFPWGLGHAWYALAAFLVTELIVLYVFAYGNLQGLLSRQPPGGAPTDTGSLGRALIVELLLLALASAPLARGVNLRRLLQGDWSAAQSVLAGLGFALLALAGLIAWTGLLHLAHVPAGPGSEAIRALEGVKSAYGTWALLCTGCVAVPILEEFLFRGVILNAFARHVPSRTAALAQAVVFAASHARLAYLPFFIGFGLLAATLARRSGGLLPSIVMHGTYNLFMVLAILGINPSIP